MCKDQELKQPEPKSSPQNRNGKYNVTNITNSQNTKENIWSTELAASSQKVATQKPKPKF